MTDEPDTVELENRIDTLESKIEKMMPSRRDALKMGGAALAGGSLMAGTASAGTNQVGTIGSASQPVDLESEDINNADTVTTENLVVNNTATGPFGGGGMFGNQIFSDTAVFSDTVTISGINLQGDEIIVLSLNIDATGDTDPGDALFMQLNDNTGSYETVHTDGTSTNSNLGLEIAKNSTSFATYAGQLTLMHGENFVGASGPIAPARPPNVDRTLQSGGSPLISSMDKIAFKTSGTQPFLFDKIAAHKASYI
jgi:hypothetical protein